MSGAGICAFLLLSIAPLTALAQEAGVPLPPGETALGDIGLYTVSYQSEGSQPVVMPPSWTGHFEGQSGISYVPRTAVLGRDAILLHSPWRVPPGKVWVDYRLQLPDVRPITLSFGIAMQPDVAVPGKSDGVTFGAYIVQDTGPTELLHTHHDRAEWQDHSFDLSPYAGRQVTLRLQTEPGPADDASWDYSYFGEAKIQAGTVQSSRTAKLQRLTSTRAYTAVAGADLQKLANDPTGGVVPGNLLAFRNSVTQSGDGDYVFTYEADDCRVQYVYRPQTGTLDDVTARVDDGTTLRPAQGGGCTVVQQAGDQTVTSALTEGTLSSSALSPDGSGLHLVWTYATAGGPVDVHWDLGIRGKALTVAVRCDGPQVSQFSLGHVGGAPLRTTYSVPYMVGNLEYLPDQQLYVCRYLDWTVSHASTCPQGVASYAPRTDGTRNTLLESGYVSVSPSVHEVLPNIPNPPSPYLELLAPRIMLDIWDHHKGTYEGDAENLRALKDNGVDHMAIISHVWQCYGYDVKLPDHLPANASFGGDEGMVEFGRAANDCGYVWSLHENYIDLYPDAPSYDPSARVLRADGTPSPAWFNAGTGVQSFGLKCNRALGYARDNSPEIHRRFATNAAYLDVHTCVPPWHQLDHEADQPMAAMALAKVKYDGELFRYMRDTHEGPLFGEGANHFYWAGKCDGVEAQVAGGEHHQAFVDFDLLKIHPQMVNHGMGYYERWFERGYDHSLGLDTGTVEQVDKYRAQEIAYGHVGFIGSSQTDNIQWVAREHHMTHPVQALYGASRAVEIVYEVDGQFVTASVALPMNQRDRQRIRYASGLTVWVNWAEEAWEVEGRILPQWGYLALGPDTEVCTTLRDGAFADYVECPEYLFCDARTHFHMPYLKARAAVEPRIRDFEYLGEDKIRLTYEWDVQTALETDYNCFVHFTNKQREAGNQDIEFQQDHGLPKPTSRWRAGETLVDGPYEIQVKTDSFDTFDVVIGLFNEGGRLALRGREAGGSRILLGRLVLARENGEITDIRLIPPDELPASTEVQQADFTAHLNPAGTMVDLGKIATDGSVKVEKSDGKLVVLPYPRDREFSVRLDVTQIVPGARVDPEKVSVRALAALTQEDMGAVEAQVEGTAVSFKVGKTGAGRYVVEWE